VKGEGGVAGARWGLRGVRFIRCARDGAPIPYLICASSTVNTSCQDIPEDVV